MIGFDYEKYRFALCETIAHMDEFHIQLLFLACRMLLDGGDRVAVEIGSYRGASTAALIEAVNQELVSHLHIVEIRPTESLNRIIGLCRFPERVTLHTTPSWETGIKRADLVFIDGNHGWPAVADALRALTWGARVICMHDSSGYRHYPDTWGAAMVAHMLRAAVGRRWFEDREFRPGMNTHRGFLVSVAAGVDMAELDKYRVAPHGMDGVVMLHEAGLPMAEVLSPAWRKAARRLVAIVNRDCPERFDWADCVHVWERETGRLGLEHCRRLLQAVRYASEMDGPTAVLEHDSLVFEWFNVRPGILYGSSVFDARANRRGVENPLATRSAFCPWVADRETWSAIRGVMEEWINAGQVPDSGYADRVISAAAQAAGIELHGIGFNRWPSIGENDVAELIRDFERGSAPLVHGLKDVNLTGRLLESIITKPGSVDH